MTSPTDQGRALTPLVRLAWRSGRDWRDATLLVVAVALPIGLGALVGPVAVGADILSIVALVVLAATVALSVGAVLAVSTKRRLLRYGRVAAIGADPTQLRVLLVVESLVPAAIGLVVGVVVGTLVSLAVGPLRFILDDNPGDTRLLVTVVAINLVGLLVVTAIGLWLAAAPAAAMALKAPAESLAARAPEPEPRPLQGRLGAAIVIVAVAFCLGQAQADQFNFGVLVLAVVAVFVGLHLMVAPVLVQLDRVVPTLPRPLRLAVRNATRNRTRFGRLTMASIAIVTLGVMASAGILSDSPDNPNSGYRYPLDGRFLLVSSASIDGDDEAAIRERLTIVDEVDLTVRSSRDVLQVQPQGWSLPTELLIVNPELVEVLDLDDDVVSAIEQGRLITGDGSAVPLARRDGAGPGGQLDHAGIDVGLGANVSINGRSSGQLDGPLVLTTAARATELGAPATSDSRYRLLVAERPLSEDDRDELARVLRGTVLAADPNADRGTDTAYRVILAIAAGFLAAFGLIGAALSGVETEEEVAAMIATGADPSIRRWFRAAQSLLQLAVAGLVGAPLGVLLFWAVTRTDNTVPDPIVPWSAIAVLAVAIPLAVAAVVALATRSGTPAVSRRVLA